MIWLLFMISLIYLILFLLNNNINRIFQNYTSLMSLNISNNTSNNNQ